MSMQYLSLLYLLNRLDVIGKYETFTSTTGLYSSELYVMPLEYQDYWGTTIIYSGRDKSV